MQSIAARFFSSFTLCIVAAIAAIDCKSYVPTFGLIWYINFILIVYPFIHISKHRKYTKQQQEQQQMSSTMLCKTYIKTFITDLKTHFSRWPISCICKKKLWHFFSSFHIHSFILWFKLWWPQMCNDHTLWQKYGIIASQTYVKFRVYSMLKIMRTKFIIYQKKHLIFI